MLLEEYDLGPFTLPNRVLMAPMGRNRAPETIPGPVNARYYAQRAGAGLIISEATQVSVLGQGYPYTPGIHTEQQQAGWRGVTEAVHAAGGRIFAQLWHVGRIGHPTVHGRTPVAPSAIQPAGTIFTPSGLQPLPIPRELSTAELPGIVDEFRQAARHARAAGFDGVEVHGANGYLLDQFLQTGTNHRTDAYGGSVANRVRLLLEVTEAVAEVWGADRVGVRVSPGGTVNDIHDDDPAETFHYAAKSLNGFGLAYLHVVETSQANPPQGLDHIGGPTALSRSAFSGTIITNGEYTRETAEEALSTGKADLVSFGRPFIANPDLPERFRLGAPLNEGDHDTFYGGDERGYTDYPTLAGAS
ncbi:alkene reductase [Streptomyces ipomoeae]|uniref:alkene reductase n=1 Tax=Streptomyces ipomoeae TaxID=103232 RepID=UPI0011472C0E|nr:alkene reductase [Streptomyces ipomoeae]MDX2935516.1 alkene reductase [Streptomyces ipomoeae]TQE18347.1 alkene reductase [Streptomyces ipomoeae]